MNLSEFKLKNLGIQKNVFGRVFGFVDFGNVNYWYEKDRRDWDENELQPNQKLIVDIQKLAQFLDAFCEKKLFYYGFHPRQTKSLHINILAEKNGFRKITKPLQFIKHYLDEIERETPQGRDVQKDSEGRPFIVIPKSNFDVEICVDSIRLLDQYDTFCLLSGDSDFARLVKFLKQKGKKVIVIAAGQVLHTLRSLADLYINAQQIKADVTRIKETSPR